MKQLVDTIIKTSYFELDDIEFPLNELFGLVIEYENFNYEFLLKVVEDCSTLTVISSSAFNKDTKHDRSRPWFNRWSWPFEGSLLYCHDPTLYLADDIYAPWGIGTPDVWYLKQISIIVSKIAQKINVYNDEILFYGSSAGGFCSLALSILVKNSIALADIPQFVVNKFGSQWRAIKKASFDMYDDETFIKKFNERLNIITLILKENYVPNAYILLDCSFDTDFKKQYNLFLRELYKFNYVTDGNSMKPIILGKNNGHNPHPKDKILYFIKQIRQIEYYKSNQVLTLNEAIENNSRLESKCEEYEKEINEIKSHTHHSETVSEQVLTTNKITTITSLKVNSPEIIIDQILTLTATVTDEENNAIKDMIVKIYDENDKLVAQETTNSKGQIKVNKKLREVKKKKFYAKSITNRKYNGSSNKNTIRINTIKHTLNSSIEESTIQCGSKARVYIENESSLPTKKAKFIIQINDDIHRIISDENGFIITPPFNKAGTYTLKISFGGNIKYNSFTKVYSIKVIK